ncbi:hypothetical protein KSP40_PGU019132 [Platanthera guangdongensis]|uniref:Tf2-1-like SH3-like domain-containing protein n=1 Tax=Platanthera guangdongensis TaxID=2320717 RepID=A0ABR2LEX6_9ASPA
MAEDARDVQTDTQHKLLESNAKYKAADDKHRREKLFEVGDLVMVFVRKKRFPAGRHHKLMPKKFGTFPITHKINDNAYIVDLPPEFTISKTFYVVPSSSYDIISSASVFLLNQLFEYEHEHQQWSSAISLGLIANCFHATDRMQKTNVIISLMKVACSSKSHLVIGACGLGLGFACRGLLSSEEVDSNSHTEATLLRDVVMTLSMLLIKLCPHASHSLENLIKLLLVDDCDSSEAYSLLPQWNIDNKEEEDTWGVAGLVWGLGNSATALSSLGVNDVVLNLKDVLFSWLQYHVSSKVAEIPLAVGACLAIPIVFTFSQSSDLIISDVNAFLICYVSLISEILNSRESGIHHQNLLMASCVGAGSLVSCILSDGVHSIRYDDIKHLLEVLRNCYLNSHLPLVQLGGMIGVVNAFGAAAGDLTYNHSQPSFLPISLDLQVSDFVRGPMLLSPVCENLSMSFVHELFLVAKESKEQQTQKNAAWAFSFLRHKWYLNNFQEIDSSESILKVSTVQSQSLAEDSLVWRMCLWLSNINYHQGETLTMEVSSAAIPLLISPPYQPTIPHVVLSSPLPPTPTPLLQVYARRRRGTNSQLLHTIPKSTPDSSTGLQGSRASTRHPLSHYVTYDSLSSRHGAFVASLSSISIPTSSQEPLRNQKWKDAFREEMIALEKNCT